MEYNYKALNTLEGEPTPVKSEAWVYPGQRRQTVAAPPQSSDLVFIKTAGNALQAVSRFTLQQTNLMSVRVPRNCQGGDEIHVQTPSGNLVSVTIPQGCYHGHVFFVEFEDAVASVKEQEFGSTAVTVMGVQVMDDDTKPKASAAALEVLVQDSGNHDLASTPVASVIGIHDTPSNSK
mmetsp:Transcript_11815/g.26241  ORF Transcript_11815/g.26241 Transcript_11815/m.26241 type:complete len:178 (+) Transcript_11815:51-584(+)